MRLVTAKMDLTQFQGSAVIHQTTLLGKRLNCPQKNQCSALHTYFNQSYSIFIYFTYAESG
jgi:hypothetical protein